MPDNPMRLSLVPRLVGVDGIRLSMSMTDTHRLTVGQGADAVTVQLPPQARGIFPLIDGRNTVADLMSRLETRGVDGAQFETVWTQTVKVLLPLGLLSLDVAEG